VPRKPAVRARRPHTQSAVHVQGAEIIGEDSDDNEAVEDDDLGDDDAILEVEEEVEPANLALEIRYCACFRDMEKNAVTTAFDSNNIKLSLLSHSEVWRQVNSVVAELAPRKVSVVSLYAVVYDDKTRKADRKIKTLKRDLRD
jgi:hypothetical protein